MEGPTDPLWYKVWVPKGLVKEGLTFMLLIQFVFSESEGMPLQV